MACTEQRPYAACGHPGAELASYRVDGCEIAQQPIQKSVKEGGEAGSEERKAAQSQKGWAAAATGKAQAGRKAVQGGNSVCGAGGMGGP